MSAFSRWMMAISSVLAICVFFFPVWYFEVIAPQFPDEGVVVYIWTHTITGENPNSLDKLNVINSYIGMKKLLQETIPELTIIPYIVGFMGFFGFMISAFGFRRLMFVWLALAIAISAIGFYDFYSWLVHFGHHLDPHAPIKTSGVSYVPQLFGSTQFLGFRSFSFPHIGSFFAGLSILLATVGVYHESKSGKRP